MYGGGQAAATDVEDVITWLEPLRPEEFELPAPRLAPVTTRDRAVWRTIQLLFVDATDRGLRHGSPGAVALCDPSRQQLVVERQSAFHVAVEHQLTLLEHAHTPANGADRRE